MGSWPGIVAIAVGLALSIVSASLLSPPVLTSSNSQATLAPEDAPPRTGIWPVNFTLYGDAGRGWGFGSSNISTPGPNITVYRGDIVNLTLIAVDNSVMHNWFIDYNKNLLPDAGEPSSPDFISGANVVWNFSADQSGNFTYRCRFHQNSMYGTIIVLAEPRPVKLALYGEATSGWGFSRTNITNPGPTLVFLWGTRVNLTLIATDSMTDHSWFIDYNNDSQPSPNEPKSPDFNMSASVLWPFVADQSGTWTYRCSFHPMSMHGTITIVGGPPSTLNAPRTIPLITGIMLGALGVVLVFAAVYHYRAVRAAKRIR